MDLNDVQRLQDPTIQAALAAAELSADAFVLKHGARADWPVAAMAAQLQCRAKWRDKLPTWHAGAGLLCTTEAYEQSSSEATAALKPRLLSGAGIKCGRVLDLCAGLGVDVMAFARAGAAIHYNDSDPVKAAMFAWNAQQFGIELSQRTALPAEDVIKAATDDSYDLIYADPSRRVAGKRVADLDSYSPDLPAMLGALAQKAPYLLLKLAPHVEPAQLQDLFPGLLRTWVVSLDRECKECLALIDLRGAGPRDVLREAVCLRTEQNVVVAADACYAPEQVDEAAAYIYDPDPALVLAGVSSGLGAFGQFSIIAQSHASMDTSNALLLTSEQLYPDFPGRIFKLLHQEPLQRRSVRRYLKAQQIDHAHVWRCQSRLSVKELRNQLGLKDASEPSCLVVGLPDGQQRFMLLERVSR